jgi:hypothetical protein
MTRRRRQPFTDQLFTVRRFKADGCYCVIDGRRRGPIAPTPLLALLRWIVNGPAGRSSREHPHR